MPKDEPMIKTTLRLPESLLKAAKHRAVDEGTLQDVVIRALEASLGSEASATATFEPYKADTPTKQNLAKVEYKKMVGGLSRMSGLCSGLSTAHLGKIAVACPKGELSDWIETAQTCAQTLRGFSDSLRAIQKGNL